MSIDLAHNQSRVAFGSDQPYRAISSLSVVSCLLAVLSFPALFDWSFGIIPLVGITSGLAASMQIRRRASELTGETFALVGIILSALFLVGGWGRLSYLYATEVPAGYKRISYDDLQSDPARPEGQVPAAAMALNGQRVFIKGYIFPGKQSTHIKQFVLVRDNGTCCFGGNPKLSDMIQVTLRGPLELEYSPVMRQVAGTFRVAPTNGIDGLRGAVYQIEADYLR